MFYEKKDKTPEENLAIAKIQDMMEDAFGLFGAVSGNMTDGQKNADQQRAKDWFDSKECEFWCESAGTTHDHILKLFQNLQYNYNTKKITKEEVRFGIRRLEKKI